MTTALALLSCALLVAPARRAPAHRLARWRGPAASGHTGVDTPDGPDALAVAAVLDLVAACLRAGLPAAAAARAVAAAAPPMVRDFLMRAAELQTLGGDAATAWSAAATEVRGRTGAAEVESLARLARRSARSGASLATAVEELAAQRRAAVEDLAVARAERAGVLISGPLGLCFLPAFLCLGIVPVVMGLAGQVLDGGLL